MDKNCVELAYPTISAGRVRDLNPEVRLTSEDVINSDIRRSDRRCARPEYLLLLHKRSQIKQLKSQASISFRKSNLSSSISAQQALNRNFINNAITSDIAYRFANTVTGTPAYWEKQKKHVLAMIRQFGFFDIFVTISMAETHWLELLVILKQTVDSEVINNEDASDMDFAEKCRLIQKDPITCALYFDQRTNELKKTWAATDGPFGARKILHSFYRIEFQHRGSPHMHMVIWLENVPKFDPEQQNQNEVSQFINEVITVDSDNGACEDFIGYQRHRCTFTCKRKVFGKIVCRFGAPFFPMDETCILDPIPDDFAWASTTKKKEITELREKIVQILEKQAKRVVEGPALHSVTEICDHLNCLSEDYVLAARLHLRSKKVFLKRKPKDCRINAFSPKILMLCRSNMDIQFVTDAYACMGYVVDYINKPARGLSRLVKQCHEEARRANSTIKDQLSNVCHVLYNFSEISAPEAAWCRLRLPMCRCSEVVRHINTGPMDERQRMLKSKRQLELLMAENPDSTNVFQDGVIEYYAQRPAELENLCLAEFVANYNVQGASNQDEGPEPHNNGDSAVSESEEEVHKTLHAPLNPKFSTA